MQIVKPCFWRRRTRGFGESDKRLDGKSACRTTVKGSARHKLVEEKPFKMLTAQRVYTISIPSEKRAFGLLHKKARRHAIVVFLQKSDAELVARGMEALAELPESNLENASLRIPVAPIDKHNLSSLSLNTHDDFAVVYEECQTLAMDIDLCTSVKKAGKGVPIPP